MQLMEGTRRKTEHIFFFSLHISQSEAQERRQPLTKDLHQRYTIKKELSAFSIYYQEQQVFSPTEMMKYIILSTWEKNPYTLHTSR